MARWILKVHTGESVDDVAETIENHHSDDVKVKIKLSELDMIIFFALTPEAEEISEDDRVAYVILDAERRLSEDHRHVVSGMTWASVMAEMDPVDEYSDDDVANTEYRYLDTMESTAVGHFNGTSEYYSQLELISKRNFDGPDIHDYAPTKTGSGVDCYILDTGINFNHPYLKDRVNRCPGFSLNLNGKQDVDDNGHGTYSALFCAGKKCGVAQDATLYSLKVMASNGSGYNSHILEGINAVTAHHNTKVASEQTGGPVAPPSVLNYSIGMMPSVNSPSFVKDVTGGDYSTLDGLKMAAAAGVHVTAAAGNGFFKGGSLKGPMMSTLTNGQMHLTPEESGNADPGQGLPIVVGATQGDSKVYDTDPHKMASFSNYGKGNTINAPGYRLVSPSRYWDNSEGTNYTWKSGTSFSAPITAGVLALHLEANPSATPLEAKTWLMETATSGNISNLMEITSLSGGKIKMWDTNSNAHLVYGDTTIPQTENWDKMQISGIDGGDLLYFDDWYPVAWMNESRMAFEMDGPPEETMTIHADGDNINFSRLDGTHEGTDGIKKWQSESDNNLIVKHEMGETSEYYYIGAVEPTDNLVLFNPYQNYSVSWQNANTLQYDENGLVGDGPSATLTTPFGEEPFDVSLEYVSGTLPCDIGVGGPIPEQVLIAGTTTNVTIKASNGYAEFEKTIGFEYVGEVVRNVSMRFQTTTGITDEIIPNSYQYGDTSANIFAVFDSQVDDPIRIYFVLVAKTSFESPPNTLQLGCKMAPSSQPSSSVIFEDSVQTLPYVKSDESYHYYSFSWRMMRGVTSLEYAEV